MNHKHLLASMPHAMRWWRRAGRPDVVTCLPVEEAWRSSAAGVISYWGPHGVCHIRLGVIRCWAFYDPNAGEETSVPAPNLGTAMLWIAEGLPAGAPKDALDFPAEHWAGRGR